MSELKEAMHEINERWRLILNEMVSIRKNNSELHRQQDEVSKTIAEVDLLIQRLNAELGEKKILREKEDRILNKLKDELGLT